MYRAMSDDSIKAILEKAKKYKESYDDQSSKERTFLNSTSHGKDVTSGYKPQFPSQHTLDLLRGKTDVE